MNIKAKYTILIIAAGFAMQTQGQAIVDRPSFLTQSQEPDAYRYLPAPPDTSSIAWLADFNRYQWGISQRGTDRGKEAAFDAYWQPDSILKGFEPVLGYYLSSKDYPETYKLVSYACWDIEKSILEAKRRYKRKRPYVQFNAHPSDPTQEKELRNTGSYPSAHSGRGWGTALLLTELFPDRADALLKHAYSYGESRVITGYHYESDVAAARLAASAVIARLHAAPAFQQQLALAKKELQKKIFSKWVCKQVAPLEKKAHEAFQGMAISGNTLVSLQNKGFARLYELPSMRALTDTFRLGSWGSTNHANVATFGVEKYKPTDALPLLYVAQAHLKALKDGMKNTCFVERILPEGKAVLVQRIGIKNHDKWYGNAMQWTVDQERKLLIGFGNTKGNTIEGNLTRIMIFPLPTLADGPVVWLDPDKAIENYTIQDTDTRYPGMIVGQGACVHNGLLWLPTGFGRTGFKSILWAWNLKTRKMDRIIDLQSEMPHELEDIDFYKGKIIMQTNGDGIITMNEK